MKNLMCPLILTAVTLTSGPAFADPQIQVIKLFDEQTVVYTGEAGSDAVVVESYSTDFVRGTQDKVILSSTPDGTGIPNMDDFVTINGEFVQGGWFIPLVVYTMTGTFPAIPACGEGISVNICTLPIPHMHPVDVSDVIPVGLSTVDVELWDFGGGYGHTELYLVIVPKPNQ